MKRITLKLSLVLTLIAFFASGGLMAQTTFNYTGSMQTYTVPAGVSKISIEAYGAEGGQGDGGNYTGGLGAIIYGEFSVTPGETINIVVGGKGEDGTESMAGGGGGGSFVYTGSIGGTGLLIVAGGGGAAGEENTTNGCSASADNYSTTAGTCGTYLNDGNGGAAGDDYGGGGGAGWYSDGGDFIAYPGSGGTRWEGGLVIQYHLQHT